MSGSKSNFSGQLLNVALRNPHCHHFLLLESKDGCGRNSVAFLVSCHLNLFWQMS